MNMAVVALIPTGKLEHIALVPALTRIFPNDTFVVRPRERHLDGFTSRDVAPLAGAPTGPIPTVLNELAAELVNAIFPGRRGEQIDFAYVVEDLELANQNQPDLVLSLFRAAVDTYIRQTWPHQPEPKYAQVRERCSFHLFRPMTEAYFFGELAAIQRARVMQPHQLPADVDLEQFRTIDPAFLSLPAQSSRIADMPDREFHPKSYLHYLCDPTLADRSSRYRETINGRAALEVLDWEQVLRDPPHCPFLHAFLDDLGYALKSPLHFVDPARAEPLVRFPRQHERILRNL
jgi:hypothetical protein